MVQAEVKLVTNSTIGEEFVRRVTLLCCSNNSSSSVTCRTYKLAALGTVSIGCMVAALARRHPSPSLYSKGLSLIWIAGLNSNIMACRRAGAPLARPPGWPTDGAEVPPEHA